MLRHDSSRSADRNRVLIQGTAAAVNAPDGAGASSALIDRAFEHGDLPPDGPDLAAIARAARFSSRGVI